MRPGGRIDDPRSAGLPTSGGVPLVHFHRDQVEEGERAAVSRDLGIALVTMNRALPGVTPAAAGRMALPLLEGALAANPDDAPAWEAKGTALWMLARREESLAAFRTALRVSHASEPTLVAAGPHAARYRDREEALTHLKRAVAINPYRADYYLAIALVHSQAQDWVDAVEAARESLRLNPWEREARMILIQCLLKNSRTVEARAEFQALLDLDPPDRDRLQSWFSRIPPREAKP